jgi:hypothetical protein
VRYGDCSHHARGRGVREPGSITGEPRRTQGDSKLAPQYFSRHIEAVKRVHLDHDPHFFGIGTVIRLGRLRLRGDVPERRDVQEPLTRVN